MASTRRQRKSEESPRRGRPAITPEDRENQLIAQAVDLAEQQMRDGTASAQVISHYIKLGSTRERLEQERLRSENELLRSRVKQIESGQRIEELYTVAINAMREYAGQPPLELGEGEPDYED